MQQVPPTEPDVSRSCAEGTPPGRTTLGVFFAGYGSRLLAFTRALRRSRAARRQCETIDDLQQASALLCDRSPPVRGHTQLYRVCKGFIRNVIRDRFKHERAEKRGGGVADETLPGEELMNDPRDNPPWLRLQTGEEREALKEALQQLREAERRVIYLRIWRQSSWQEIATELHLDSEDAARMRYRRALGNLEQLMSGAAGEEAPG